RRRVGRRAHAKPDGAGACAREDRVGGGAHAVDQPGVGAPVHHRSAGTAGQPEGRGLVGSVRVASADGIAHRGAQRDGVSREFVMIEHKTAVPVLALCASTAAVAWLSAQSPARIRGFSPAASAAEIAREREMKAAPNAKANEADFDVMTAEPHHTGSPYEIKLADYVADKLKSFGIDATKYEYSVLLPWPGERRMEITAPDHVRLQVEEEKIRGDQWADKPGILPAYNAYSPSGDVSGEIVYVNFGIPADYETLAK